MDLVHYPTEALLDAVMYDNHCDEIFMTLYNFGQSKLTQLYELYFAWHQSNT